MATFAGDTVVSVTYGGTWATKRWGGVLASSPVPTHYVLAMFDNVNVRHIWTDATVSSTNAPAGFTYVTATLTVLGSY